MDEFSQFLMGGQSKAPAQTNPSGANQFNVGNVRPTGKSTGFEQPANYEEGIKLMDQNLSAYGTKHKINTLRGAISRWAPPEDKNDTEGYIKFVSEKTGLKPDQEIDLTNPAVRHVITGPMMLMEKGGKSIFGSKSQQPADSFSSFLMGGASPEGEKSESTVGEKPKSSRLASTLKGAEYFATGGPMMPKVVRENSVDLGKNVAAFLDNTVGSIIPFGAKQIGYLFGRTIGDSPEKAEQISTRMASIVDKPFGKAFGISNDPMYKNEATGKLFEFIGENVGKGAGWIADKTGLPKSDIEWMINTALPKVTEVVGGKVTKTGGKAVEKLTSEFEQAKAKLEPTFENVPTVEIKGVGSKPTVEAPVAGATVPESVGTQPKVVQNVERAIVVPEEMPVNRAETKPFTPDEISARESLLNKIGLDEVRTSALNANPKEAASQFITSQADQGPYATGMTNQINLEKAALDNHFKKIQDETGGTVIRHGTSFQEGDKIRVGKTIKDALQEGYEGHQKGTTALYKEATDTLGNSPVQLGKFNEFLKADENFAYQNEKGLQTGINQFLRRKQFLDDNGNLKPLTVAQAEEVRKYINSKYHHETKQLGGELKGLIDKDVFEAVGGETYEKARKHYQKGIEVYDNPKAVGDLLGDNGVNQKIPDEKVASKVVTLPNSQFNHLFNTLEADGQVGAVNQIKTSLVEQIREAGNSAKDQPFNSVAAAKEAAKLSEKLKTAFKNDPKGLEAIYDGIEAADILYIPNKYPGAGVQTNMLQNKFVDVGIRRAFGSAGGAVGSLAGPLGAAGGAIAGEAVGGKVSGKVAESKQQKALKKEIKSKEQEKNSLQDIYKLKD